jgi:hypothetical protein
MRPPAAGAAAICTRCLRSGDPRLRQCHCRRDESRARRSASARYGRGDGGLHRADQLRLRHAVDRHRLSLHPRRQCRSDPRRGRRSAQPRAAGLAAERRALVRRACHGQGCARQGGGDRQGPAGLFQADHRPRARSHRSDHRPQYGPDRREGRAPVRHHACAGRCLCRRKPQAPCPCAGAGLAEGRSRDRLRPQGQVLRPR